MKTQEIYYQSTPEEKFAAWGDWGHPPLISQNNISPQVSSEKFWLPSKCYLFQNIDSVSGIPITCFYKPIDLFINILQPLCPVFAGVLTLAARFVQFQVICYPREETLGGS